MSPFGNVQNTRENYYRHLGRVVVEVLVQFKEEDPAWIPLDTLLSIQSLESK